MKPLPSDYKILREIYDAYYETFSDYKKEDRSTKIYVPVDLASIADQLRVDPDIVFGRLYYYLNEKYGYQNADGSNVHLFSIKVGDDTHAVNFPLLGSVLASMREEQSKFAWATTLSIIAITISVLTGAKDIVQFFIS
jgi:hypothetical protein